MKFQSKSPGRESLDEELGVIFKVFANKKRRAIVNLLLLEQRPLTRREIARDPGVDIYYNAVKKHLEELVNIHVIRETSTPGERGHIVHGYILDRSCLRQLFGNLPKIEEPGFELETMKDIEKQIAKETGLPKLVVDSGVADGIEYPIDKESIMIGRLRHTSSRFQKCDILLTFDGYVSRNHARIFREENTYFLEDKGSTNKTILSSRRLGDEVLWGKRGWKAKSEIKDGDRFKVGVTWLKFIYPSVS